MRKEEFTFINQGIPVPAILWLPDEPPRYLLQITHGMTEHIGRYEEFARSMTAQGIAVAGFDLRGHGRHPGDSRVASFGQGGWEASIEDIRTFFLLLEERFPGIPHFMHGFSLGSFLLREYLGKYPAGIAGVVLMGTGNQPGWLLSVMQGIVKGQIKQVGFDGYSPLVRQLSFGVYNQNFKPNRTEKDWLCSDEQQIDRFLADPLCRDNFSAGLFYQMLGGMKRCGTAAAFGGWNKEVPILLLYGERDPVGNMGKGVAALKRNMDQAGFRDITMRMLPGCRHDLLHEEANGGAEACRCLISEWMLQKA